MPNYPEDPRLRINQTGIASSCECSWIKYRNVLNQATELDITWPLKAETT